jgi:hypothetical protein
MATLTVSFTPSQNAVKYRIKYRRVGTSAYTTTYVTTSPATISVDCGYEYEGTVEAICVEGIPCNSYFIQNPSMQIDGDIEYTDCVTGNTVTQAVPYGASFSVCSRTTPVALNVPATVTNMGASQACAQSSPINEEASGPVYWTASAIPCGVETRTITINYNSVPCSRGTGTISVNGTTISSYSALGTGNDSQDIITVAVGDTVTYSGEAIFVGGSGCQEYGSTAFVAGVVGQTVPSINRTSDMSPATDSETFTMGSSNITITYNFTVNPL